MVVVVRHDVAFLALCLMLWVAARSPVSSPVTSLLGTRIPVSFLVCHQPKLTAKPRANARSSSPVADKAPPFCPRACRGTYPLFSPSAFFITRRHRILLLCLSGVKAPDTASLSVGGGVPNGAKICKTTFVASIHFAFLDTFGIDNVTVERCEHMRSIQYKTGVVVVPHALEVVVLDAVLARSRTHPKPLCNTRATVDKPVKMHVDDDALLDPCHDARFRAMVVVLPEAGVFYCHRERRKACVGVLNSLVPLDMELASHTPEWHFSEEVCKEWIYHPSLGR